MKANLDKLEHIVAVARDLSFSKASEKLSLTQPALSKSVAETERRLGVKIFDRGRGGTDVTALGQSVITEAQQLLEHARLFEENVSLYARGEIGRATFSMAPVVASTALAPVVAAMLNEHSGIELQPMIMPPQEALVALRANKIDVAVLPIAENDLPGGDLIMETLFDLNINALVRKGHPLAGLKATIADIENFKIASGAPLSRSNTQGAVILSNFDILKQIALSSDIVWFTSTRLVQDELQEGSLVSVMSLKPDYRAVMVRRRKPVPPAVVILMHKMIALLKIR